MNSESSINQTPVDVPAGRIGIKPADSVGKRQSYLFWLCALAAAGSCAAIRGSVKFAVGVLFSAVFCAAIDRCKPRFLFQPGGTVVLVLGIVFCAVSGLLFFFFANIGDVDFACYTSVLWNTLHGRFLYQSFLEQNLLAVHLMPLVLVFIPFYALFGNYGLIAAQVIAWGIGLWLLFFSDRPETRAPALLVCAIAFLPPVVAPLLYGFHPDVLFFPVSAWAFLAFKKKSFRQFCIAVLLLPLIKEVFICATLCFAFLALWEKRPLYWSTVPAAVSLLLVSLFWFVLSPALRIGASHPFASMLPPSFNAMILQLLSWSSVTYLALSLLLVLPALLSHSIKIALFPLPFFLFYAALSDQSFRDLWRHYALAGTWLGLFSLAFCSADTLRRMAAPFFLITLCSCFIWLPLLFTPRVSSQRCNAITAAISSVPSDKSLVAHGPFMAAAAERSCIMNWTYANDSWQKFDFFLIDGSFKPAWWPGSDSLDAQIARLRASPGWVLVFSREQLLLFRRNP